MTKAASTNVTDIFRVEMQTFIVPELGQSLNIVSWQFIRYI